MEMIETIKFCLTIIPAIVGIWVAYTATCALSTWKKQIRTQIKMQFLDNITDTIHEYIQLMSTPIQMLEIVNICIKSHTDFPSHNTQNNKYSGIISYIENNGKNDQKKLFDCLDKVRPVLSKMNSLSSKGQVLGFHNYKQCHDACSMLAWSHEQISAFAFLIGNTNLCWQNEDIQKNLDLALTLDSFAIRRNINEQHSIFLGFVKNVYQTILN